MCGGERDLTVRNTLSSHFVLMSSPFLFSQEPHSSLRESSQALQSESACFRLPTAGSGVSFPHTDESARAPPSPPLPFVSAHTAYFGFLAIF